MEPSTGQQHESGLFPHVVTAQSPALAGIQWASMRELFRDNSRVAAQMLSDYYAHFERAFPAEGERPPRARLEVRLQDPSSPLDIVFARKGDEILGGRQFKIFESDGATTFAAGEFLFVNPEYRRSGLGKLIMEQSEHIMISRGVAFTIGEFHDPKLCTARDRALDELAGVTPEGRLEFWAKRDYRQFNAPYICAPVFGSSEWLTNLTLGYRQLTPGDPIASISSAEYLNTINRYWESFSQGYRNTAEYHQFMGYFENIQSIEIIPLTTPRTFYQQDSRVC